MLINAVWACFVDFSHVIWPPPLSDHGHWGGIHIEQGWHQDFSIWVLGLTCPVKLGSQAFWVRPKILVTLPWEILFVVVMRKSDWQITVILLTRPAQSIKQQTNVAEAHWSFLDVLIISSPLCIVKSNMAATMWICFVRNFFYMSLKQQNLFKIQSKWSEFFKSISYTLGRIKILMIHFLHFVCIKMRDFCVNTISVKWVEFRENA